MQHLQTILRPQLGIMDLALQEADERWVGLLRIYIMSIMPYDTPIPSWAFTNELATGGTFNPTAARFVAENTNDIPDTAFKPKSESTTGSSLVTAASCSSSVNTGATAGGTVGGFVGGTLLDALASFLAARKKRTKASNDDGRHSIHSQESQDMVMYKKARIASLTA